MEETGADVSWAVDRRNLLRTWALVGTALLSSCFEFAPSPSDDSRNQMPDQIGSGPAGRPSPGGTSMEEIAPSYLDLTTLTDIEPTIDRMRDGGSPFSIRTDPGRTAAEAFPDEESGSVSSVRLVSNDDAATLRHA